MFAAKIENSIVFVFVVQCLTQHAARTPSGVWGVVVSKVCVGGFSVEGTPGPVPIPVAKLDCADGTAIVGLWESKTPPTHKKLNIYIMVCGVCQNPPRRRVAHPTHFLCFRRRKAFLTSHRCITA